VADTETGGIDGESALHDPVYGPFVMAVLQSVLETLISNGEVLVGEKTESDLLHEAADYILARPRFFDEWMATPSHEESLLEEARRYVADERPEFAIMMFATWIEHRLNWLLMDAARRRGLTLPEAAQIMRDANMPQKTGSTWLLLFGEPFDTATKKDIEKVSNARNIFVHYKWPEGHLNDGPPKQDDLARAIEAAERAVRDLDALFAAHVYGWNDGEKASGSAGDTGEGAP